MFGRGRRIARRTARRQSMMRSGTSEPEYAPPPQQEYAAPPPPAPAAEPDYLAEIERLSQLKQEGMITDEEFEAKKKQILGI